VLDFGLAKAVAGTGAISQNPAVSQSGMIVGTAAYMSPEQAGGQPVDQRTDIWAFGVILFEMLTGKPAFQGNTTREVLNQIAGAGPDLNLLPAFTRPVIGRCLSRDSGKRWRSIADVRLALDLSHAAPVSAAAVPRWRIPIWATIGAGLLVTAALVAFVVASRPAPTPSLPLVQMSVDMGFDAIPGARVTAAISPDGSRMVFQSRAPDGKLRLSLRRTDQANSVALDGTEDGFDPFFSPDGKWIGFFTGGFFTGDKMMKISVDGGAAVLLCETIAPRGASWGDDGNIVVTLRGRGGLSVVPDAGGTPKALTKPEGKDITHRWPQILPGGKAILYTAHTNASQYDEARVDVLSLQTGKSKTLETGAYFGRYIPGAKSSGTSQPNGHLLYVRQGTLMAAPFDVSALEVKGAPVPVVDDLASDSSTAAGEFDFSRTGTLIYRSRKGPRAWPVAWLDGSGEMKPLIPALAAYMGPKFSPDGTHLAFAIYSGKGPELYSWDINRGMMARLTSTGQASLGPVWTPDGKHIVFYYSVAGGYAIGWIRSDGQGEVKTLLRSRSFLVPYSFSPDGRRLAYYQQDPQTNLDLWTLPLDLANPDDPRPLEPQPFLKTASNEVDPMFSPDGRWLAYASDESGRLEIYVRPFPGAEGKWQISSDGGEYSFWAPGGRELYYETMDHRIMVVSFQTQGKTFAAGKPRVWSSVPVLGQLYKNLDLHPDGKRFAVFPRQDNSESLHLTMMLNFADELARKAPLPK